MRIYVCRSTGRPRGSGRFHKQAGPRRAVGPVPLRIRVLQARPGHTTAITQMQASGQMHDHQIHGIWFADDRSRGPRHARSGPATGTNKQPRGSSPGPVFNDREVQTPSAQLAAKPRSHSNHSNHSNQRLVAPRGYRPVTASHVAALCKLHVHDSMQMHAMPQAVGTPCLT